ncbi:transmembrane protein 116 [Cheilinus undulatus]|uniref:transmembrane protein 116 n=1 Tax=Cheilinus undulatus TaxID=241271 RepID=UPI001BD4B89E|nr:transmembrane protein 116 [Cheilinus undulatus]
MGLEGVLRGDQIDALSTEYLVLLTPSVIGSVSVVVVSIARWRQLKEQVHLLVQLALADLLAALILMSTSILNKVSTEKGVTICQYFLPLSLTFYFISFLLVMVYAWKSKSPIQGWRARPTEDEGAQSQCRRNIVDIPVYAIVWLIPIIMYLAYVLTPFITTAELISASDTSLGATFRNDSEYCTSCILFLHVWRDSCSDPEAVHDSIIRVSLVLIVIIVLLSCSIIYYNINKWYERHGHEGLFPVEGDGRSRRRIKRVFSTARNMIMVILFCWTPALVLILLSCLMLYTNIEQRSLFFLYVIQAASVSLQGFLNSMVYAWRRPNFTEAVLGETTPLVAQAFFEESLRPS